MKFWQRFRRVFVRARVNDIEESLWEDGRKPFLRAVLSGSFEERLADINEKLDLLAEQAGFAFKQTYNKRRSFELITKEQDEKERESDRW